MVLISQVDQYLDSFYMWDQKNLSPELSLSLNQLSRDSSWFSMGWIGIFIIWFVDVLGSLNEGTTASEIDSPVCGSFIHN